MAKTPVFSKNSKATTSGSVDLEFKCPGTYGSSNFYMLLGLQVGFSNIAIGDSVDEIIIIDIDNKMGNGANFVVAKWHSDSMANYQTGGKFFDVDLPFLEEIISHKDKWHSISPELYLRIVATKASGEGTLYANLFWMELD